MKDDDSTLPEEAGEPNPEASTGEAPPTPAKVDNATAAELRRLRKAHKAAQQKIEELEGARTQAERAKMDELDRLKLENQEAQTKLTEAESRFQEYRKRTAFESAARDAGAVKPSAAFRLADLSKIEFDEAGEVSGVEQAIKALQKSDPYLFGPRPATTGTGGGNPSSGAPKHTPESIRSMSDEEYMKLRASFS